MAYTRKPAHSRGVKVYGRVKTLDLAKHRCIFSLEKDYASLGKGVLDTSYLEKHLEGVSDMSTFLAKSTDLIVKVEKLTRKRKAELNWYGGEYAVLSVIPTGMKPDVGHVPHGFVDPSPVEDGDRKVPSIAYCQQLLERSNGSSAVPPEETADAISAFRKMLQHWAVFPLRELLNVVRHQESFTQIREYFVSPRDIAVFAGSFPQYFKLSPDGESLGFPHMFFEDDFSCFLERHRSSRHGRPSLRVITDVADGETVVSTLMDRARTTSSDMVIALDFEGVNMGVEGGMTLLQIGTTRGEAFLFDLLATPDPEDMLVEGGLKTLLEETIITKVIHDCRTDQCALYHQFGVALRNVFDTSVAYTTIWDQCNFSPGASRPKLAALFQLYELGAEHKTKDFAHRIYKEGLFGQRPLTREMKKYLTDEVRCLLAIFENLNSLISPLWRPHFQRKVVLALDESRVTDPHLKYERTQRKQ